MRRRDRPEGPGTGTPRGRCVGLMSAGRPRKVIRVLQTPAPSSSLTATYPSHSILFVRMAQRDQFAQTARALHLQHEYLEKSGSRDASLLPRRVPAVPDLRFEQSYLSSIRPYVHIERSSSSEGQNSADQKGKGKAVAVQVDEPVTTEVITIQWGRVAWVTTRDQILSPFLQGTVR